MMLADRTIASAAQQRRPHPLGAVITWELRHSAAQQGLWLLGLILMLLMGGITALATLNGDAVMNSAVPLQLLGVGFEALKVGVILLTIDLVARDRSVGVHELLMTSALPSWAYVWGRWLAGIIICMALSLFLLLGVLLSSGLLAAIMPELAPPPAIAALTLTWLVFAVLGIIPVGAISFALGTALPGRIGLLGALFAGGWAFGSQFLAVVVSDPAYRAWVPNAILMALQLVHDYSDAGQLLVAAGTPTPALADWRAVWQTLPNISHWLPQLLYVALGIGAVALTAGKFQRFRERQS